MARFGPRVRLGPPYPARTARSPARTGASGSRDQGASAQKARPPQAFPELTEGEEILALIAGGHDNAEIAARLFPSLKTVQNHVSNIFHKLRVADRVQSGLRAREAGLGG